MIFTKNFLLLSISFFSIVSETQEIDPDLISQLSPSELEAVIEALSIQDIDNDEIPAISEVEESLKENTETEDTAEEELVAIKYGYDFFSSMPTSLSAVGDLPLPNDYRISLKDQFRVILSGSKDQIFNLNVNLDGTILFPELGSVFVAGLTLQEVKNKLLKMVNQSYIGVNIDISLQNLSAKKITIVGAVETPGTYLVNPFSTITGALAYSGGISEIGSLRDIKLIKNDGTTLTFDLYDLLIKGDRSNDLTIDAGDTILINSASQFVEIKGAVNRPAIYEILEGEDVSDIVQFALGFTQTANKSNISISILDLAKASIETKSSVSLDQKLKDVLVVDVFDYVNSNNLSLIVSGAVEQPGFYDLKKYNNLNDLIDDLNFIDVYPWLAILEQFDDNNLVKSTILFSLNDESTYQSIELLPNSKIFFANIFDVSYEVGEAASKLIDEYSLTINYKDESYEMPVIGKYSVNSFVKLLGLDMSDVDSVATYISPLDSVIVNDNYKQMNFEAKKYNNISLRSPVNDLITVSISGAVDYPGTYTLKSDSTISDLYKLMGNFKKEAFLDGIILTREVVRTRQLKAIQTSEAALNKSILSSIQNGENVGDLSMLSALAKSIEPENLGRIAGNFSPLSSNPQDTILFDGDELFIPKKTNVLNVIGSVLNPIAFEFSENTSIEEAISRAGGYQSYADKRRVYVIKANGLVDKNRRNVFIGNSKLEPGDTIVVPRKINTDSALIRSLAPVMQIVSDLSFSAAALDNLTSN